MKKISLIKAFPFLMVFLTQRSSNLFWGDLIGKFPYFLNQVFFLLILGNNWKFDKNLDTNEQSNVSKNRGLVTSMLKGIEKKEWSFGDHPKPDEHLNTVKVLKTRGSYVSWDLNGVVHFWK